MTGATTEKALCRLRSGEGPCTQGGEEAGVQGVDQALDPLRPPPDRVDERVGLADQGIHPGLVPGGEEEVLGPFGVDEERTSQGRGVDAVGLVPAVGGAAQGVPRVRRRGFLRSRG